MARSSFPITLILCGCASLVGCDLPTKSSGEVASAGMDDGGGGDDADDGDDAGDDDTEPLPPGECVGDCTVAAEQAWSRVVPTTTPNTWACDVQVDAAGRVAFAWRTEGTPEFPQGRTGIDLMNADGTLAQSTVVDGQTFASLAFASDGTLRARGATIQSGDDTQWVMALDDALEPTWTVTYGAGGGNGQCDWGGTGALVDATDHIVTYGYSAFDPMATSFIRRHAPDGTLLWEVEARGNPGDHRMPIAVADDQSVFYGEIFSFDASDETEVRKFSPDGEELWSEVVPDEASGLWAAADGGVYVQTRSFYDRDSHVHRLGPDGSLLSVSPPRDRWYQVIGAAADGSGFFAIDEDVLVRTDPQLDPIWTANIEHAEGLVFAGNVAPDEQTFAFASTRTAEANNYWVSVLAKP